MKFFLLLFFSSLIIISCGSNKADEPIVEEDSLTAINYTWQASLNDSTGKLEMKKAEAADLDSLSTASIVDYINRSDSSIHLDIIKISNDTVYLKIPDAHYLTQQMGSTGPTLYLANVVYNLTEIPGFHYISFDFEEGDHASPGTMSRESFKNQ